MSFLASLFLRGLHDRLHPPLAALVASPWLLAGCGGAADRSSDYPTEIITLEGEAIVEADGGLVATASFIGDERPIRLTGDDRAIATHAGRRHMLYQRGEPFTYARRLGTRDAIDDVVSFELVRDDFRSVTANGFAPAVRLPRILQFELDEAGRTVTTADTLHLRWMLGDADDPRALRTRLRAEPIACTDAAGRELDPDAARVRTETVEVDAGVTEVSVPPERLREAYAGSIARECDWAVRLEIARTATPVVADLQATSSRPATPRSRFDTTTSRCASAGASTSPT